MRRNLRSIVLVLVALLVVLPGCRRKEERSAAAPSHSQSGSVGKRTPRVIIPASVKGKWKAVKIAVMDKETHQRAVYTIPIGSQFDIPGSGLTLKVDHFLPAFIMEGDRMTSVSNELKNPAALVEITERGKEIFKGWLFSLYPGAHAFHHPRFNFTLVDFVRAEKKRD